MIKKSLLKDIINMRYSPRTIKLGPRIMYNISNAVIFTKDLKDFFIALQDELDKVFDAKNLFISFYNQEDDTLSIPYFMNENEDVDVFNKILARNTLTGYMIREDKPLLINEQEMNDLAESGKIGMVSSPSKVWMGVPLKILDKTIGALVVQHYKDEGAYGTKDIELLRFVSSQISMSIETKRLQEESKIQKAYFEQLFEDSPDCVMLTSKDGKLLRVSQEFEKLFGYSNKEALGYNIVDLIVPEEIRAEALLCNENICKGEKIITETIRRHKEGSLIDVSVSSALIEIEGGQTIIYSLYRNISDQKRAEQALRESEEKLRNILQSSPNAITISDLRGNITEFNQAALDIFECDNPTSLIGVNGNDFVIPSHKKQGKKSHIEVIRSGSVKNLEFEIRTFKGNHRYLELSASLIRDDQHKPIGIATINQDITAKKNIEKALREHEQLLNQITSSAKDGIVVLDNDGHVIFWNKAAENIFGHTASEMLGDYFHKIVPARSLESYQKGFEKHMRAGATATTGDTYEFEALHKSGLVFPVEQSLSTMEVNDRLHSVSIIRDVSQRKEYEQKLEEAKNDADNANRAKSEFLANMSHEIRTPMNAILGFSEILEEHIGEDPRFHDYITGIRNSGKGLLGLINDILDLSKIEAGQLDISYEPINPFNLIEEIRQIFSMKTLEKKLDFQINVDKRLPKCLLLDETRLRQVLFNLIGNAIKFTSKGGITVNLKIKDRELNQDLDQDEVNITIEVVDTGIGIPLNEQQAIFEPFRQQDGQSTRKYGGTGLGLSITQRLVKLMGGSLSVSSSPGSGSAFTAYLPGIQVAAFGDCGSAEEQITGKISFNDARILLVEDIASNRKVIRGFLDQHQVNIYEAEDGSKGIEKAREFKPDLILMDIQMPEMNGIEASRILKSDKELNHIPIVILTASIMKKDKKEINKLCDGYLPKPLSKDQLLGELKKHLPFQEDGNGIEPERAGRTADKDAEMLDRLKRRLSDTKNIPVELKLLFAQALIPEYQEVVKHRSNKRIRSFAEKISETGSRMDLEELETYGKELSAQVNSFNILRINKLLKGFEEINETIINHSYAIDGTQG
jgi:PAS domain S-box-containing protein